MDDEQKKLAEELLFSNNKPLSFAKKLYFGIVDSSTVFPYPTVSQEEKENTEKLVKAVNEFADAHINADMIDRHASIPDNVIEGLAKLGVLGITIPKEHGGLGMSQYAYCRVAEALAMKCSSTALFVNAHQSVGLKALLLFGTPEQKGRWLHPLAKGTQFAAFSLTEPNAGSDANGIETRAIYDPERNVYKLNGQKQWTTNGSIANVLTVMAKTEIETPQGKQDKVTAFLVTPNMPGFKVTAAALEKVGMRGTKTSNLAFNDMEVPAANILGPLGGGLKVCLTVLDYGRTTFGATCTGAAKLLLNKAKKHAKSRYQFKRPLASFALVKKKIATIAALTYAMEATTYLTAGLVDADVEDFMLEAAMLKVFSSDSLWKIVYETMQIYGGRSFFTTEPLERLMRDSRLNMIGEGANEVMRVFIAIVGMREVGMELKTVADNFIGNIGPFALKRFNRWKNLKISLHNKALKAEAKRLEKNVLNFNSAVMRVLSKYREEVMEKQLILDRIATSAMAIYTTIAVLSKLDSELQSKVSDRELEENVMIGKIYCRMAMDKLEYCLKNLFSEDDALIEFTSDTIIKGTV